MIVNAFWYGRTFPFLQQMCAKSWLAHNHVYRLWVYGRPEGVPDGVEVMEAHSILDGEIYKYQNEGDRGSPVLHANLFRYRFLKLFGGAFVDADTLCLSNHQYPKEDYVFSSENAKGSPHPNFAYVQVPEPQTTLARGLCDNAFDILHQHRNAGAYGPRLLKRWVGHCNLEGSVLGSRAYCPLSYSQVEAFFAEKPPSLPLNVKGVHLWQRVLTKTQRDLEREYPLTSLWETWKRKYG